MSKKRKRHKKINKGAFIAIIALLAVLVFAGGFFSYKRIRTTKENNKKANLFIQIEPENNPVFVTENKLYSSVDILDGTVSGRILNTHEKVFEKHVKSSWGERAFFSFLIDNFSMDNLLVLEFSAVSERSTPALVEINCGSFSTAVEVDCNKNMYYIPLNDKGISGEISFIFDITGDATPITFGNFCVAEYTDGCSVSNVKSGQFLAEEFKTEELSDDFGQNQSAYSEGTEEYLYSVVNGELDVYDVTGSSPLQVGVLSGLGNADYIFLSEEKNVLLITSAGSGVYLVDISNPETPVLNSFYEPLEIAGRAVMYGNYAFICEEKLGIEVVDYSDLSKPQYVTRIQEQNYGVYKDCKVENGYLYAVNYEKSKTDIYDIHNLANVSLICELPLDANGMSIDVQGDYLYVVTASSSSIIRSKERGSGEEKKFSTGFGNGFEVFDVSNPARPVLLCRKKIDGRLTDFNQNSFEAKVVDHYGFFSFGKGGIYVYDISNPAKPKRLKYFYCQGEQANEELTPGTDFMPYLFEKESRRSIVHSAIGAGRLYCITSDNELLSADEGYEGSRGGSSNRAALSGNPVIAEPQVPENYSCKTNSVIGDVFAVAGLPDGNIVLACGMDGLKICTRDLNEIASFHSDYPVKDIRVSNDLIYAAEGIGGFAVYRYNEGNVEQIARKTEKKYTGYYDSLEVSEDGKVALVQAGFGNYKFVDCTDPTKLRVGKIESGGTIRRIKHRSVCIGVVNHKYLGIAGPKALNWFYETQDAEESQLDSFAFLTDRNLGNYNGLAAFGSNYVLITNRGYQIINPETDKELHNVTLEEWDGGKCITDGNLMIVSNAYNGKISILDLSNPDTPEYLLQLETNYVTDVPCMIDGDIYVPLRHDGVMKISKK